MALHSLLVLTTVAAWVSVFGENVSPRAQTSLPHADVALSKKRARSMEDVEDVSVQLAPAGGYLLLLQVNAKGLTNFDIGDLDLHGMTTPQPEPVDVSFAETAQLTELGYLEVQTFASDEVMTVFVKRLLNAEGKNVSAEGEFAGVIPYYSGTKAKQSFEQLKTELSTMPWVVDIPPPPEPVEVPTDSNSSGFALDAGSAAAQFAQRYGVANLPGYPSSWPGAAATQDIAAPGWASSASLANASALPASVAKLMSAASGRNAGDTVLPASGSVPGSSTSTFGSSNAGPLGQPMSLPNGITAGSSASPVGIPAYLPKQLSAAGSDNARDDGSISPLGFPPYLAGTGGASSGDATFLGSSSGPMGFPAYVANSSGASSGDATFLGSSSSPMGFPAYVASGGGASSGDAVLPGSSSSPMGFPAYVANQTGVYPGESVLHGSSSSPLGSPAYLANGTGSSQGDWIAAPSFVPQPINNSGNSTLNSNGFADLDMLANSTNVSNTVANATGAFSTVAKSTGLSGWVAGDGNMTSALEGESTSVRYQSNSSGNSTTGNNGSLGLDVHANSSTSLNASAGFVPQAVNRSNDSTSNSSGPYGEESLANLTNSSNISTTLGAVQHQINGTNTSALDSNGSLRQGFSVNSANTSSRFANDSSEWDSVPQSADTLGSFVAGSSGYNWRNTSAFAGNSTAGSAPQSLGNPGRSAARRRVFRGAQQQSMKMPGEGSAGEPRVGSREVSSEAFDQASPEPAASSSSASIDDKSASGSVLHSPNSLVDSTNGSSAYPGQGAGTQSGNIPGTSAGDMLTSGTGASASHVSLAQSSKRPGASAVDKVLPSQHRPGDSTHGSHSGATARLSKSPGASTSGSRPSSLPSPVVHPEGASDVSRARERDVPSGSRSTLQAEIEGRLSAVREASPGTAATAKSTNGLGGRTTSSTASPGSTVGRLQTVSRRRTGD